MNFRWWVYEVAARHPNVRHDPQKELVNVVTYIFELSNGGTVQVFESAYEDAHDETVKKFNDLCDLNDPAKYKIGKNGVSKLV